MLIRGEIDSHPDAPFPALNRRLRLGVVGGGRIAATQAIAARLSDRWEVVAGAFSSDPARAKAAAADWFLPEDRCYETFEAMARAEAARPDGIEAVMVTTPNHMHFPAAQAFLDAGIDVLCDKPLTNEVSEAEALVNRQQETGLVFGVSYVMSCFPMIRQARELVAAGALGTLNQISYLPQPTKSLPPVRLTSLLKQTLSALHNRNFRLLFLATLLSAAINGTGQVFDVYMNLYFWQFGTDDIRWFSFALLGAAMAFVSVGPLQELLEKHQIMIYAMTMLMVMAMLKVSLRFLQIWPDNGAPNLLPMLVAHASIMAYGGSLVLIMFASMVADIVDEQEHLTDMRQEGTFSAGVSLAGKSTTGLGLIIGGLLLDWVIAIPAGATPEAIPTDVVIRLGVVDGLLVPAFYLIPILLIRNYRLDRHQLSRLQQNIRQRRRPALDQDA